ncbi:MAG: hypothetical protein O3C43_14635 [Verrucomicrobia bacterium]|nr:hypothetical protein [Verrucomicrobiota bacterium]
MLKTTSSTKLISWVDYSLFHSSDFNWIKGCVAIALVIHGFALRVLVEFAPPSDLLYVLVHCGLAVGALVSIILLTPSLFVDTIQAWKDRIIRVETGLLIGLLILFAVSVVSSFRLSEATYYEVIPLALAIYTLSRYWLSRKKRIIDAALPSLFSRVERCNRVEPNGSVTRISLIDLKVGEEIKITTDQVVPVDGVVITGNGYVSEASLNGSNFPKLKQAGDPIYSGSVSEDGVFTIKCLSPYIPRKIQAVMNPLLDPVKSHPMFRSRNLLIGLLVVAMAVAGTTVAIIVMSIAEALILTSTILIMGTSLTWVAGIPVHHWTGLVHLGKRGLYGKGHEMVGDLATVNVGYFGKTGVISREELSMERFFVMPAFQDREDWIMSIIYQISRMVRHPLVNSLSSVEALIKDQPIREDLRYEIVPGMGVKVSLTDGLGHQIVMRIGESEFVLGPGGESRVSAILEEHDLKLGQRIWVSLDNRLCAIATLKESWTVAPQPFFSQLELLGIKPGVLTGDSAFINSRLDGLSLVKGLSSMQKQEHVIKAAEEGGRILYVGDGLNDFRAMSSSLVSIAMRHSPDPVLASASAVLKSGSLATVLFAIPYCRKLVRISIRNLWVLPSAFTVASVMAIAGWITPISASLYVMGCFSLVWLQSFLLGSSSLSRVVEKTRYRKTSRQEAQGRYVRNR